MKNETLNPEKWVDDYGDYLYSFALMRLRDAQLAEDLVQETFLAALRAKDNFEGRSSEKTWLTGILKRKIIDHYRSKGKTLFENKDFSEELPDFKKEGTMKGIWEDGYEPSEWEGNPQKAVNQQEFWTVLNVCLDQLPKKLSAVFTFREIDGYDTKEICKFLDVSSTNLWVILHKARTKLRRCLEINWFTKK